MLERSDRRSDRTRPPQPPRTSSGGSRAGNGVIVLANRAPFTHERTGDGRIVVKRTASGLVTALEPLFDTCTGTWVAHGSGSADSLVGVDRGGLNVPRTAPRYRLRYVLLAEEEHRGYYYGFANEALWPLCHAVGVPPVFRPEDFLRYRAANGHFAAAVVEEGANRAPIVLVQDYHFALAPRLIRRQLPSSTVVAFWHIPWPRPDVFGTCPWARELLEGLLGSHRVGLQTPEDCENFLASVGTTLDADVDLSAGTIRYRGYTTSVRAYPVGVDWANPLLRTTPAPAACRTRVCRDLGLPSDVLLGIGIDRLDYTKGINEKLLAVEHLLKGRPDLRGRFVFVQVAEPSRGCLPAYQATRARLLDTAARVNTRFGSDGYRPIRLLEEHHEPADVYRLYRAADLCVVNSLHDGMNLVAKEFVSTRDDERGVLVLSRFTGAAQQLRGALLVDPCEIEEGAAALARALVMPQWEQASRMRLLRTNVKAFDASWWARQLIDGAMRDAREIAPAAWRAAAREVQISA
jgi:trehalose 6-phosphate synthase